MDAEDPILVEAQQINDKMYRNYLSNDMSQFKGWCSISTKKTGQSPLSFIEEKLRAGARVSAGYYTTSVQQYHDHYIFWKE